MPGAKTLSSAHKNVTLTGQLTAYGPIGTYTIDLDGTLTPETIYANVFGPSPTNFTIHNQATITNAGTSHFDTGIALGAAGTIINTGEIRAPTAIAILGATGVSSIQNNGGLYASIGNAIYSRSVADITNDSFIYGKENGIILEAGGTLTNQTGPGYFNGITGGLYFGVQAQAPATILNSGFIYGYAGGLQLTGGGYVNNAGQIGQGLPQLAQYDTNAAYAAIELTATGSVNNSGTLTGSNGIKFKAPGNFENPPTGTAAITNTGLIDAVSTISVTYGAYSNNNYGVGIYTNIAAMVNNQGTVYGSHAGVIVSYAAGTVTNGGLIASLGYGVELYGGGTLTNTGTIYGYNEGVFGGDDNGAFDFISNTGLIAAAKPPFTSGIINPNTGQPYTFISTALFQVALGSINNAGTVSNPNGDGIALDAFYENFTLNTSGYGYGSITNSGTVAALYGINFGGLGGVTNTGTVLAPDTGIQINTTLAQVYNSGLISVSGATFSNAYGAFPATGILLKKGGVITNATTGTIAAPQADGIIVEGGGTVINTGTIIGGAYAISFAAGYANRLVIDSTSTLIGTVNLNGGAFEFAAGPGIGTFAPENLQVLNAGSITIDTGAVWDIAGTFTNGTNGILLNDGTIKESTHDLVDFNGPIIGTGLIDLSKKPLSFNNSVASTQTIAFTGTGETLALGDPKAFHAKIEDFKLGDTIDLTSIKLSAITATHFAKGILTLSESSTKLEFTFANPASFGKDIFALAPAGHGTAITLAPAAALLPLTHVTTLAPLSTFS